MKHDKYVCFFCGERRSNSASKPPEGHCPKNGEFETHLWLEEDCVPRKYREYCRNKKGKEPLNEKEMCYLGNYYADLQDWERATEWFLKAAQLGSADAMLVVGNAYLNGHGIKKDTGEASAWYQKAAKAGNETAKQVLFQLFENGNTVETLEWIKQETDAGNLNAVLLLASSYESGKGVAQDKTKAMKLYRQIAEKVTVGPSFMIGGCICGVLWDGIIVDVLAQTDENDVYDMTRRGYAYEHGNFGVEQDKNEALKWYQKAAEAGGTYAMFVLGNEYASGEHQDKEKALMWYRKAAEKGLASAKKKPSPWEPS